MLKKGDKVVVASGRDAGRQGQVLRALPATRQVVVEGLNLKRRRERARKSGEKGQVVETAYPLPTSVVRLWCSKCGKGVRVGVALDKKSKAKTRVCKKCGSTI